MNNESLIETLPDLDYDKKTTVFKQKNFILCESCFWCASALSLRPIRNEINPKCPMCDEAGISIVPISRGHV